MPFLERFPMIESIKSSPEYDRSAQVNGEHDVRLYHYDYEIALNFR